MDTHQLIDRLSDPAAYPHPVDGDVVVHQTHISVVFLAGEYAYKFKKPRDLGFLDFSTVARRKHFCQREVELNRRLAPEVFDRLRVIVDATFYADTRRRQFLSAARDRGVPGLFVVCETSEDTARARLAGRKGDASDADWKVYQTMRQAWEDASGEVARQMVQISAEGPVEDVVARAVEVLRGARLFG